MHYSSWGGVASRSFWLRAVGLSGSCVNISKEECFCCGAWCFFQAFTLTWFLSSLLQEMFTYNQHRTQKILWYMASSLSLGQCTGRCILKATVSLSLWEKLLLIRLTSLTSFSSSCPASQLCLQRLSSLCLLHGWHPHGFQRTLRPQGGSQLPVGGLHREDPLPPPRHGEPHLLHTYVWTKYLFRPCFSCDYTYFFHHVWEPWMFRLSFSVSWRYIHPEHEVY